MPELLKNYIGGKWGTPKTKTTIEVVNPATREIIAKCPISSAQDVESAAHSASKAFQDWKEVPPSDRVQYLFRIKQLLEENIEDLARTITLENGKTQNESRGELRRAIENVEVACGIPTLMQGGILENIASGIDEFMLRQPLGVCAIIAPFNFPGMIPFWFLPYAIACGNTVIVKPSERTPITMQRIFELLEEANLPPGIVNLVNGSADTVNNLIDHSTIRAISFVGSTPVARHVYSRAATNGKRVQAQGGAKNPIILLPDADIELTTKIVSESAFGCAGQRCLAASLVITIGEEARRIFRDSLVEAASELTVGYGMDDEVQMGPVISNASLSRIENLINRGEQEGGKILLDGRKPIIIGFENGHFIRPTILDDIQPQHSTFQTEIFGPVLGLMHTNTVEEAIAVVNKGQHGNMASLFTGSGAAARQFRHSAEAGNIGINIGVAAPMAFFPFSGWKESFFGTLHGQSNHAVEFFTQTKVVVERWPTEWTRRF